MPIFLAALLVSCGDRSDGLTIEEYFAEFEAIDSSAAAGFQEASADFPETDDPFSDESNLPLFQDLVTAYERTHRDRLASVMDLDPPSEAANAHNDFVDAQEALLSVVEEGNEALQRAETMAEIVTMFSEPSVLAAATAFEAACLALDVIAKENNVTVALACAVDG